MQQLRNATPNERFVIYLNDHRGLLATEHDLARRAHAANRDSDAGGELVAALAATLAQSIDDRDRIDALLASCGGRANPIKTFAARLGERLGRLKFNGQFRGYSPLSKVVELEALVASTAIRRSMWGAIATIAGTADLVDDATLRSEIVAAHHERLSELHLTAARNAF